MLLRRAERHARADELDTLRVRIDELLVRYQSSRLLDDARYAQALVRGLQERGSSLLRIRQKLRQRGIDAETLERTLAAFSDGTNGAELAAARAYARRRRLATRYDLTDPAARQKALAALARQGFSYGVASAALAPPDETE